jgi:hypothetical protein
MYSRGFTGSQEQCTSFKPQRLCVSNISCMGKTVGVKYKYNHTEDLLKHVLYDRIPQRYSNVPCFGIMSKRAQWANHKYSLTMFSLILDPDPSLGLLILLYSLGLCIKSSYPLLYIVINLYSRTC